MKLETTDEEALRRDVHMRMKGVAQHLRLPLGRRSWRGQTGNWLGVGIGSSIDFQDHRPYLPGDDPRYIDWMAYARTGQYTMKLYREEVSPNVDLLLDVSSSMTANDAKRKRMLELLFFAVESVLQVGASMRCYLVGHRGWTPVPVEAMLGYRWGDVEGEDEDPVSWTRAPFRHGSMRVWISDLLFPGAPEPAMRALTVNGGFGVVYVPWSRDEAEPSWSGNVEFVDCETGFQRKQKAPPDLLQRYREAYRRHFEMWFDRARQFDVAMARIPDDGEFVSVLAREGLPARAVEACN